MPGKHLGRATFCGFPRSNDLPDWDDVVRTPSEEAKALAETGLFSAWEVQEVLDAIGEGQGADLIRTARKVGINNLVSTVSHESAVQARLRGRFAL